MKPHSNPLVRLGRFLRDALGPRVAEIRPLPRRHGLPVRPEAAGGRGRLRAAARHAADEPAVFPDRRAARAVRPRPDPDRRVRAARRLLGRARQPVRRRRDVPRHALPPRRRHPLGHVCADHGGAARAAAVVERGAAEEGHRRGGRL